MNQSNSTTSCFFDKKKPLVDYPLPLSYERMMAYLEYFQERYPFLEFQYLGTSVLGRPIPILTLGQGEKTVLYIGAHHGMEWITAIVLLRFINEYCEAYQSGRKLYNASLPYLFAERRIQILPMLNPDGVAYAIEGVKPDNPFYERLKSYNPEHPDYSHWQSNARGVDLNHNYDAGFEEYKKIEGEAGIIGGAPTRYSGEMPESEPEVGYLCNYLRFNRKDLRGILTFHTQGEEIYYSGNGSTLPRSLPIAKALSRLSGYTLSNPDGMAAYGGLTDWSITKLGVPSFTIECGRGTNPLPQDDYVCIYATLRQMLFEAPFLM